MKLICVCAILTCSWELLLAFNALPPATSTTSCGNGDSDGDGCRRGLAEIDGDGLGVRNGPGGDNIPATTNGKAKAKHQLRINKY